MLVREHEVSGLEVAMYDVALMQHSNGFCSICGEQKALFVVQRRRKVIQPVLEGTIGQIWKNQAVGRASRTELEQTRMFRKYLIYVEFALKLVAC